ncbi:hypothetical protein GCM10011289_18430 [Paludibacterium paludis]|uniref:Uncharacterized protein n=1 Tax=Paludibacterium paludis TaxID=1225769 RepID=A0A918P2S5_9NEIS|nr:hypothetical protein GCM10011289_18430 [Paludibacterium paludis]
MVRPPPAAQGADHEEQKQPDGQTDPDGEGAHGTGRIPAGAQDGAQPAEQDQDDAQKQQQDKDFHGGDLANGFRIAGGSSNDVFSE